MIMIRILLRKNIIEIYEKENKIQNSNFDSQTRFSLQINNIQNDY